MDTKYLISVCGLPGSGKSTLASNLALRLQDATRIRGDHYLLSRSAGLSWDEYFSTDQYDWELIASQLHDPLHSVIETPTFDYNTFTRINKYGNKPYTISKYNIVDAVWPMPSADLVILIDIPQTVAKARVTGRNREHDGPVWRLWASKHDFAAIQISTQQPVLNIKHTLDQDTACSQAIAFINEHLPSEQI